MSFRRLARSPFLAVAAAERINPMNPQGRCSAEHVVPLVIVDSPELRIRLRTPFRSLGRGFQTVNPSTADDLQPLPSGPRPTRCSFFTSCSSILLSSRALAVFTLSKGSGLAPCARQKLRAPPPSHPTDRRIRGSHSPLT